MGFRFRRSIRIAPGLRINLGKKGASVSVGGRGLTHTMGSSGSRTTIGLPGTGVSYSHKHQAAAKGGPINGWAIFVVVIFGILLLSLFAR